MGNAATGPVIRLVAAPGERPQDEVRGLKVRRDVQQDEADAADIDAGRIVVVTDEFKIGDRTEGFGPPPEVEKKYWRYLGGDNEYECMVAYVDAGCIAEQRAPMT